MLGAPCGLLGLRDSVRCVPGDLRRAFGGRPQFVARQLLRLLLRLNRGGFGVLGRLPRRLSFLQGLGHGLQVLGARLFGLLGDPPIRFDGFRCNLFGAPRGLLRGFGLPGSLPIRLGRFGRDLLGAPRGPLGRPGLLDRGRQAIL